MREQSPGLGSIGGLFTRLRQRRPDLETLARSAGISGLDSAAEAWCSDRYTRLRQGASWLSWYGSEVVDVCHLSYSWQGFGRRGIPKVSCTRMQGVICGFDGDLAQGLGAIAEVLGRDGWANGPWPRSGMEPRRPAAVVFAAPPARLTWEPTWAIPPYPPGMPPGLQGSSPVPVSAGSSFRMELAWGSDHAGIGPVERLTAAGKWPRGDSDFYRLIDVSGDMSRCFDQVLANQEHVLAVRISVGYYRNPDARRYRFPR